MQAQRIRSIKKLGEQDTLDLSVESKDHNFYAEGIVVSNCYAYSYITAYTTYLKANHPIEFYWASLFLSKAETKPHECLVSIEKEMRANHYKLLPPHLVESSADFKIIDDKSIRYGLSLVRGVSDKKMEKLEIFRGQDSRVLDQNKFMIFQSLKNAGLDIAVSSSLVQAGCLEGCGKSRSRTVLELCTWNLLSDTEKSLCLTIGPKPEINWDVLNAIIYLRDNLNEKGKPLMKKTRFETIKRKYEGHKTIFEMNRRNERLANYWYEKTVLGYSYSETLRGIFGEKLDGLVSTREVRDMKAGETVRVIGFVKDPEKGKTKAGNQSFKFTLVDETEEIRVMIFNDKIKRMEECNGRLPEESDILILRGKVMEGGTVFADECGIQTAKIFLKLSELKDESDKRAAKAEETTAT